MPPPEEAALFPETVDHAMKFDPVPLKAIPPPSAPDRLSATVEWSIPSPVPKMAPPEPPALLWTARTRLIRPPEVSGAAAHVHRASVAGGAVSLEQCRFYCEVEGGGRGRGGECAPVTSRDVADQAAVEEIESAATDRPAVADVARASADVAVSHDDPGHLQPGAVHVEDPVDVVAVDDGQLRAPVALPHPHQALRPHNQGRGHVKVARGGGVLAQARPGELVAPAGAQQNGRCMAAALGR